ncbi:hypothetical protein C2G38_2238428 [Gigaspora rosea]|uniref:Uncharacterized protein n=1 Tax=Gigaspora rosea TaxID=44941 RepID=A0A397WBL3_9GLOM|nr:hypothetical protein C2G38_2238428 [Gigaspora rosea]
MLPSLREMLPFPCGLLPSFKGCYAFFFEQKFLFVKPIDSEGGVDYAQTIKNNKKRCDGCGRPEYAVMCSGPIQGLADSELEKIDEDCKAKVTINNGATLISLKSKNSKRRIIIE